jgi:demethylmenaquinone methyltransferase/2-methoxy-6-polyprenyl-1,4-benzoquinol methylase
VDRIYPDSKVEVQGFLARKYDKIMDTISFGLYDKFIKAAIRDMKIAENDRILDLGCGTGRNACLMRSYLSEKGSLLGMDISDEMGRQFKQKCAQYKNTAFRKQRIDVPFEVEEPVDKAFISFVIHGFPHEVRLKVIENVYKNLKQDGQFCILDFSEFSLKEMPFYYRIPFKLGECPYAFDYIERDWKQILREKGFVRFDEFFMFKKYVRLLIAHKS